VVVVIEMVILTQFKINLQVLPWPNGLDSFGKSRWHFR